jgi:hypothetical protein
MAHPALAKSTKHVVCAANKTGDGWDCGAAPPAAAPAPAAASVPVTAPAAPATVAPKPATAPQPAVTAAPVTDTVTAPVTAPAAAPELPAATGFTITPAPAVAVPPAEATLDWTPIDQVPAELRDLDCLLCQGRYMDPLEEEDKQANPEEAVSMPLPPAPKCGASWRDSTAGSR